MKLLLTADLHYSLRQWDWLGAQAPRFDLLVLAGDHLDISSIVPIDAQIVVVSKYLRRLGDSLPVLASSGNHDIVAPPGQRHAERRATWLNRLRLPGVRVDGQTYETTEILFSILPWWDGPAARREIENQLAENASRLVDRRWIWIYHAPPQGSTVAWNGHEDHGDPCLVDWIHRYRPEMVLGGHIHAAPFRTRGSWIDLIDSTFVFNSGRQPGGIPAFTVIDTTSRTATWISAEGAEEATLAPPLHRRSLAPA